MIRLEDFQRVPLGFLNTPIEPLARIGAGLGIDLSAKRDDFTGFGGGGNKIRKLEYLVAEALAAGATTLITAGGLQSNHARMTAAAARKFGMKPLLVLRGERPNTVQGNLLLDQLFDAEIDYFDAERFPAEHGRRMQDLADAAALRGEKAYVIPVGGSNALGAVGYVACVKEMAEQYAATRKPAPDVLVVPLGSGGTFAGILAGCAAFWPTTRVIGIAVTVSVVPFAERMAAAVNAVAERIGMERRWTADEIEIEQGYVGPGYAIPSEDGNAAIRLATREEGMILDPVYTAKGFAGLIGCVRSGAIAPGSSVLFLHTGGSPALFHYADALI
jgi:D-cysteine desulfhydrase family pyridoxal phosphate-dependent enzyme